MNNLLKKISASHSAFLGAMAALCIICLCGAAQGLTAINGYLQSDLEGRGNSITGVNNFSGTNVNVTTETAATNNVTVVNGSHYTGPADGMTVGGHVLAGAATNQPSAFDAAGAAAAAATSSLQKASNLSDLSNPSAARTNLALVPGVNVQPYYANTTTLGNTLNGYGQIQPVANTIPANSAIIVMGDSLFAGFAGSGATAYWPQYYLSQLTGFTTTPVYSFAVAGQTSGPVSNTNSGQYTLSQSSPAYVKFLNGTRTTGNASVSSLVSGTTGTVYVITAYGANDAFSSSGISESQFKTYVQSIWSTVHGYGANVKVVNLIDPSGNNTDSTGPTPTTLNRYYNDLRSLAPAFGSGASYPDICADLRAVMSTQTNGVNTSDPFCADGIHPTPLGAQFMALLTANDILLNKTLPDSLGSMPANFNILAQTSASAAPGSITMNAGIGAGGNSGMINISGGVNSPGTGVGGTLDLRALNSFNGGNVTGSSSTFAQAGSLLFYTGPSATGNAGSFDSHTVGAGAGGNVNTSSLGASNGGSINTSAYSGATRPGGTIDTHSESSGYAGQISTFSQTAQNAGSIITASYSGSTGSAGSFYGYVYSSGNGGTFDGHASSSGNAGTAYLMATSTGSAGSLNLSSFNAVNGGSLTMSNGTNSLLTSGSTQYNLYFPATRNDGIVTANAAQSLTLNTLGTPSAPTVTPVGTTGSTTYSYAISAQAADGMATTLASTATTITNGNATLNSTNYNTISWSGIPAHCYVTIYRTVGGATQGKIYQGSPGTTSFNDTANGGSGSVPAANTTGSLNATNTVNCSTPQTAVSGSTSGTATFTEPFAGSSDKRVNFYCAALTGTASYTFPTPFTNTPSTNQINLPTGVTCTAISPTAMTLTGTGTSGGGSISGAY